MGQSGLTEGGTTRPAASAASAWRGSVGVRRAVANAVTARARSAEFVSGPHPSTGRNAPTPVGAKGGNVAISEPELPAMITPPMIRLLPMWLLVDGICARSVFIPRRPEPPVCWLGVLRSTALCSPPTLTPDPWDFAAPPFIERQPDVNGQVRRGRPKSEASPEPTCSALSSHQCRRRREFLAAEG